MNRDNKRDESAHESADQKNDESAGYRHSRLQGLIREELVALFRDEIVNPALFGVRILVVNLSVDYRHARVHFALAGGERGPATRALERVIPFLRARLAEAIDLKRVPDLRFVFDAAVPPEDDEEREDQGAS